MERNVKKVRKQSQKKGEEMGDREALGGREGEREYE